jgi:hypothetical protein
MPTSPARSSHFSSSIASGKLTRKTKGVVIVAAAKPKAAPAAKDESDKTPEEKTLEASVKHDNEIKNPVLVEDDPEDGVFEGQQIRTDEFSIVTGDSLGRPLAHIAPANWVGDAPLVIPGWKIPELIEALEQVKSIPDSPKAPVEPIEENPVEE